MERPEVIENSIKVLVGVAQSITFSTEMVQKLVAKYGYLDANVYELIQEVLDSFQSGIDAIEDALKDEQAKKLYDFQGASSLNDCPLCDSELVEISPDRFVCMNCGFELELEGD